jgi:hypothetical protein
VLHAKIICELAFHRVKIAGRSRGYIVVICAVVLRGEMTTGKTAEASALQGDGTSSCYQYDICLKKKNRGIIIPV